MPAEDLPEGTDTVVTGAGVDATDEADADAIDDAAAALTTSTPPAKAQVPARQDTAPDQDESMPPQSISERIDGLKGQAGDRARAFVTDARDRAAGSIDDVVRMIHDAATEVDDKIGPQYGDYIRRAADSVSGLSEALKGKEADDLFAEARELIKKAPGVAIGAAAALGFVVARLAKAGADVTPSPATEGRKA